MRVGLRGTELNRPLEMRFGRGRVSECVFEDPAVDFQHPVVWREQGRALVAFASLHELTSGHQGQTVIHPAPAVGRTLHRDVRPGRFAREPGPIAHVRAQRHRDEDRRAQGNDDIPPAATRKQKTAAPDGERARPMNGRKTRCSFIGSASGMTLEVGRRPIANQARPNVTGHASEIFEQRKATHASAASAQAPARTRVSYQKGISVRSVSAESPAGRTKSLR
jgi:hypothetical protein